MTSRPMPILTTPRMILRPFTEDDIPAYSALRAQPEVARWLPKPPAGETPIQLAARTIDHFNACWDADGVGPWAVIERASLRLIGHCGLRRLPEFDGVEVLYTLAREYWRRGLASEAASASLDFGFGPAGLERIFAITLADNNASRGVMEKLGLRYRRNAQFRGFDVVYYDIDRASWLARSMERSES